MMILHQLNGLLASKKCGYYYKLLRIWEEADADLCDRICLSGQKEGIQFGTADPSAEIWNAGFPDYK